MAARLVFSTINDKCLGFAALFVIVNLVAMRLADDWTTKLVISTLCFFFLFCAFALDAFLSYRADEEWKAKNLSRGTRRNTKND